ncbi:neutral ceramidase [Pyronema domesticum]|uniref:Neutral ceramidase n=1 Tax=Pyronema omphalodes (strain CBS 100304) TaxID=1076935 RepID=U4KUQ7_PYROM|nr:neutral ceramidase [Pyronema domesticum]CCX04827.1 Similar to Neutral ceramidase; acc. no. Q5W7F1 [Pyronema omphalodes CBS 100304]
MRIPRLVSLLGAFLFLTPDATAAGTQYTLGTGIGDITGPVVEIGFMGYASADQKGTGLRQRIFSRAFLVGSPTNTTERWVYINVDTSCGDTAIRDGVLRRLQEIYGGLYHKGNVAVVGTHQHSGPGGWMNYLLPQITFLGFDKQSYQAIVDGIVLSVKRAHDSAAPGYLSLSKGLVAGANVNRSPYAYEANPAEERKGYEDIGGEVDKVMTALTFTREDGTAFGQLNWFPVHGTSMYLNNTLVTGDNKGLAAIQLEKDIGNGFIAGFSQANVGDTSPNTQGAFCQDTGLPCTYENSTCNGRSQQCIGRGPAWPKPDLNSCEIVATKQYQGAKSLLSAPQTDVSGPIRSLHTFVDMSTFAFTLPNGTKTKTCAAALGYSFAAGTTDGPGAFDFTQNDPGHPSANPMWRIVSALIRNPSEEQKACHGQKPILLDVGEMHEPYDWSPNIVDFQLFRVGNLGVIVSPGEATTMAGRRWRAKLIQELEKAGEWKKGEGWTVIGGPANTYTHYITTPEEYDIQRYEGASTLYGPNTLAAYLALTEKYAGYLKEQLPGSPYPAGPQPQVNTNRSFSFITGVVYDSPAIGKTFGQVLTDVNKTPYSVGQTVAVKFVGANPRNNLRLEGTFVAVERQENGEWKTVRDDKDWGLVYRWKRTEGLTGQSEVTVEWKADMAGGFRIRYFGDSKSWLGGKISPFEGTSGVFTVT